MHRAAGSRLLGLTKRQPAGSLAWTAKSSGWSRAANGERERDAIFATLELFGLVVSSTTSGRISLARLPWRLLVGFPGALLLLAVFCWTADHSIRAKSMTYDEVAHLVGGASYWETGDFRLYPEQGMLAQLWLAVPLHVSGTAFPSLEQPAWGSADSWVIGDRFVYDSGNDPDAMLRSARRMILVVGVLLGLLVYAWSRRLFGPVGGFVSLVVYTFDPNVLAHARLATSDVTAALFFTAAVGCVWRLLHRVSPMTVLVSGLVSGLLFLAKPSAPLLVPIVAVLIALRTAFGGALVVRLGSTRTLDDRRAIVAVLLGACVVSGVLAMLVVWALHGFRYDPAAGEPLQYAWETVLRTRNVVTDCVEWARTWQLLPERYLFGIAHVNQTTSSQPGYLLGEFRTSGWWFFYPYSLLVKTPVGTLAILAAAVLAAPSRFGAAATRPRACRTLYRAAPLVTLLLVYWAFVIPSSYNLGLRHVLPTYGAMTILAGGAALWLRSPHRLVRALVPLALLATVVESLAVHPHYLAFFNCPAGGPERGYRHLVDSSLDWGQDLPGLAAWLEERDDERPVYLAYFGTARPRRHGVEARRLSRSGIERHPLTPGSYCISATALANVYNDYETARGPWTDELEAEYARVRDEVADWEATESDPVAREELLARRGRRQWITVLRRHDMLRLARLVAYLREREPDAQVGYSILIYELSDADIDEAL